MSIGRLLVIQHDVKVPLGELAPPLMAAGLQIEYWKTWETPTAAPDPTDFDGVVSLGSFSSVCDEQSHEWMGQEIRLLGLALEAQIPVLGVCFGAQILARAAGGRVFTAPEPEMGWLEVSTNESARVDPLLGVLGETWPVLNFNFDTFEPPADAVLLASTTQLPQAYRLGTCAWGIQFHIEATIEILEDWIDRHLQRTEPYPVDFDALRADAAPDWPDNQKRAWALGMAFAEQVARSDRSVAAR